MNKRHAATINLQRPTPRERVCPHCQRVLTVHRFLADGHWVETHHCQEHGDVRPMTRDIVNPETTS
ncbi:MAG: hypothetical protein WAV07_14315 [Candidatus Contendobacter sp.]